MNGVRRPRGQRGGVCTDLGRPGERDLVDLRVADEVVAEAAPEPVTTLKTPSGTPASSSISAMISADRGVSLGRLVDDRVAGDQRRSDLGLERISGKLNGVIAATTPIGSR